MTKKIFYLDDEVDQIFTLEQLFSENRDIEVKGTTDAEEFLGFLKQGHIPDIIFLDIMMKDVSGWEIFDKIRENPSWAHIPIVFLTARTDDLARDAGAELGEGYIEKPFDKQQIYNKINTLLTENDTSSKEPVQREGEISQ